MIKSFVFRVGFAAVSVFFVFASFNYIYYHYLVYRSKNNPDSAKTSKKIVFIMFVSSLAGALFFLMVTFFVYWFIKRPVHP